MSRCRVVVVAKLYNCRCPAIANSERADERWGTSVPHRSDERWGNSAPSRSEGGWKPSAPAPSPITRPATHPHDDRSMSLSDSGSGTGDSDEAPRQRPTSPRGRVPGLPDAIAEPHELLHLDGDDLQALLHSTITSITSGSGVLAMSTAVSETCSRGSGYDNDDDSVGEARRRRVGRSVSDSDTVSSGDVGGVVRQRLRDGRGGGSGGVQQQRQQQRGQGGAWTVDAVTGAIRVADSGRDWRSRVTDGLAMPTTWGSSVGSQGRLSATSRSAVDFDLQDLLLLEQR